MEVAAVEVTDEMVEAGSRAAYGDHFERYRGLIRRALDAALVKAERERAWQPIETAPGDGESVLLWYPSAGRAFDGFTYRYDDGTIGASSGLIKGSDPSHWRVHLDPPLPSQVTK